MRNAEKKKAREYVWRKNNPDRWREIKTKSHNKRSAEDPKRFLIHGAKSNAPKRGLEFTITADDITIPTHCPVFGTELRFGYGTGRHPNTASIDRIDPARGYVPGNIEIMSARANRLKSDGTLEEFEALIRHLKCRRNPP